MILQRLHHTLICCFCFLFVMPEGLAREKQNDGQMLVVMRMIGHEFLLSVGDSSSRVLPVSQAEDQYTISFDTEFSFYPDELVVTIDSLIKQNDFLDHYLLEVRQCTTEEVVYSYEVNFLNKKAFIPCRGREQPRSCYKLVITVLPDAGELMTPEPSKPEGSFLLSSGIIIFPLFLLLGLLIYLRNRRAQTIHEGPADMIGRYQFNQKNMELLLGDEKIELTSKESDLLGLLYASANKTVERETMLREVWGDDGDYIGRTLDVFISKLRKKLSSDPGVKIANVRGVGYKLILN
jgi:hypothetical protein